MAVLGGNITTALSTTGVGWRKLDILESIILQDPRRTPLFELSGMATSKSREHSWQTRGLRARGAHAQVEGSDFTYRTVAAPTRVTNFTQIFMEGVEVSGSLAEEAMYGASDVMRDQLALRSIEHRNDIEWNLLRQTSAYGDTDTAHTMTGLLAAAVTNTTNAVGDTFTETKFIGMLETVFLASHFPPNTVLVNTRLQKTIDLFDAEDATRWVDAGFPGIKHQILTYHSSFGTVEFHHSPDLTNTANTNGAELVIFDRAMIKKAWFRTTFLTPAARTADADRMEMISELTLQYDAEKSIYYWRGRNP